MSKETIEVTIILVLVCGFSLIGVYAENLYFSPPMFFLTCGALVSAFFSFSPMKMNGPEVLQNGVVLIVAELTLTIILFHDASTVRLRELSTSYRLPLLLLFVGFPLCVLLHFLLTFYLLPDIGFWRALLIAGALSPTDAGLSASIVLNPKVPSRIRQAINVESGLNDGLGTPVVLLALAALTDSGGVNNQNIGKRVIEVFLIPLAIAVGVAMVLAPISSLALDYSSKHVGSTPLGRSIALTMLPFIVYGVSKLTSGNAFIGAFLTGLIFGITNHELHTDKFLSAVLEAVADLLSDVAWYFAGGYLVLSFQSGKYRWEWAVLAICSLTILRLLPGIRYTLTYTTYTLYIPSPTPFPLYTL